MLKRKIKCFIVVVVMMFTSGFSNLQYQVLDPKEACNQPENVKLGIHMMFRDLMPLLMMYDQKGFEGIDSIKSILEDEYRDSYWYILNSFKQQEKLDRIINTLADLTETVPYSPEVMSKLYQKDSNIKTILDIARGFFYHEQKILQKMYTEKINKNLILKNPVETAERLFFHLDKVEAHGEKTFLLKYITDLSQLDIKKVEEAKMDIVIPAYNCTPHDVVKNTYGKLGAFMDPLKTFFMGISTINSDLESHKLTFYDEKYGFETNEAYRIWISFYPDEQTLMNFSFSPFEITHPKSENEVKTIADDWVKFFDSIGWEKTKRVPPKPYGTIPERGCWPYQVWESDGMAQSVNICLNDFIEDKSIPQYFIKIVFEADPDRI